MSFIQGAKNFLGGINDTMNYPSIAIGEIGAFLSPRGSNAERLFKSYADSARNTSDMGQNRQSAGYVLGRVAPGLAVYGAMPAWSVALGTPAVLGLDVAGMGAVGSVMDGELPRAVEWQQRGNGLYNRQNSSTGRTVSTPRQMTVVKTAREPISYLPAASNNMVVKQPAQYASYLPAASNNTVVKQPAQYANYLPGVKATNSAQNNTVKNTIAKTLKVMRNSGQLNSNPQVAKGLINLYNRLK